MEHEICILRTPLIEPLRVMLVLQQHEYRPIDFGKPPYTDILLVVSYSCEFGALTAMTSLGSIRPFCHTLVTFRKAGIHDKTSVPLDEDDSSSVGSSQTSAFIMAFRKQMVVKICIA